MKFTFLPKIVNKLYQTNNLYELQDLEGTIARRNLCMHLNIITVAFLSRKPSILKSERKLECSKNTCGGSGYPLYVVTIHYSSLNSS